MKLQKEKNVFSFSNFLIAFLASGAIFLCSMTPFMDTIERRFLDFAFMLRGPEKPHPAITLVTIDDNSLQKMGAWPWPRQFHAKLLSAFENYKPKTVFFDIIFSEPQFGNNDSLLAEAFKKAGNVILPFYFNSEENRTLSNDIYGLPIPSLKEVTSGFGFANSSPDKDGHMREFSLVHQIQNERYYHTSLVIASHFLGIEPSALLPKGQDEKTIINFPAPYEHFQIIPYTAVLRYALVPGQNKLLSYFKDKIVLIGHTAAGTAMDLKPTPFSNTYPGVAVQASMLHTILSKAFIHKLPNYLHWFLLLFFGVTTTYGCFKLHPWQAFSYTLSGLIIIFEIRQLLFQYLHLWLPYFSILMLITSLYIGITLYQFVKMRIEAEVISRELALASRIQNNFLPSELPQINGMQIAASTKPARQVGGDLYDVLPIYESISGATPNHAHWGICIGDVSGKGVPAALFMAKSISEFRREASSGAPASVIGRVNKKIAEGGFSGLFITLLYLIIDPVKKNFSFSNGGHEPIFFYQKKTNSVDLLKTDLGTPLGIDSDAEFDEKVHQAEAGDILVLISDGIKEAMNSRREIFGNERIQSALIEGSGLDTQALIAHLLKRVDEFVKEAPQHDDMTLVCIKFS